MPVTSARLRSAMLLSGPDDVDAGSRNDVARVDCQLHVRVKGRILELRVRSGDEHRVIAAERFGSAGNGRKAEVVFAPASRDGNIRIAVRDLGAALLKRLDQL